MHEDHRASTCLFTFSRHTITYYINSFGGLKASPDVFGMPAILLQGTEAGTRSRKEKRQ